MKKFEIGKIFGKWTSPDGQEFVMAEMDVDMYHNKGVEYLNAKKPCRSLKLPPLCSDKLPLLFPGEYTVIKLLEGYC